MSSIATLHANLVPRGRDSCHLPPQPSPPATTLTTRDYQRLLTDLRRIIREGQEEAQRAAAQALIESYWSIGRRIAKEKLNTRAAYHNAILTDLSVDLGIGVRTLQRTVTFYQTYKRPPRIEGLTWAHYRILMQLQDPAERAFYETLAVTDALSTKRLTSAIQGAHYDSAQAQPKGKPLNPPAPHRPKLPLQSRSPRRHRRRHLAPRERLCQARVTNRRRAQNWRTICSYTTI